MQEGIERKGRGTHNLGEGTRNPFQGKEKNAKGDVLYAVSGEDDGFPKRERFYRWRIFREKEGAVLHHVYLLGKKALFAFDKRRKEKGH